MTMRAAGMDPSKTDSNFHQCVFTSADGTRTLAVNATVAAANSLSCITPSWGSYYVAETVFFTVEITYPTIVTDTVNVGTVEAVDLTPSGLANNQTYGFYQTWWNVSKYPDPFYIGGDAAGHETVSMTAYGLDTSEDGEYQCAFHTAGKILYSTATAPVSTSKISCTTPE